LSKTFTIYRSSAGSGKTRTLAREYLKLALRYRAHYFKHILAVTFTNKATQEMKDRILAYLDEFASGKPGDLAEELQSELKLDALTFQQYAQEAQSAILHEYSHFSISTIDAFFQKVIRSFTREAGLAGDYRLEIDQEAVLEEVIDNLIDELGNNPELTEWVVEFAKENLENEKSWDVRTSLMDFSKEIFREEFKTIENDVVTKTSGSRYFRELQRSLTKVRSGFLRAVVQPAKKALTILGQQPWDQSDIAYGKQSGLYTFLIEAASLKRVKDLKEPKPKIHTFATDPGFWPSKKTPHAGLIRSVAESQLAPLLREIIEQYHTGLPDALSAEVALQNLYVFGLVADISRKLREYKSENNLMLLADAPKFLNGVIAESDTPFIYEKVGSFYKHYLIDEFQDTSGLQWKNFLPLLLNGLDQGLPSLVVGDVKQAIYRWRGGDLNLLHQTVERNIGAERVNIQNLNSNYRSTPAVVDFNNEVFAAAAKIVSAETGHSLSSSAYEDVAQRAPRDGDGYVDVRFLLDEKDGRRWKEKALDQIPVMLEQLQEKGVRLKDIAIIVRKNEEGQDVINHLLRYKLSDNAKPGFRYDVVSGESLRLDTAATVNLLEGAMKYLLNPDDDIARAQLAFEFARLFHPGRKPTEVFAVTNQSIFESFLPSSFTSEKSTLKKLPLFELTETLIGIFELGHFKGELPYLQSFQNLVLDFFTRERNDLGAFLEWWEVNKKKKSLPVSDQVDAAQIVSIHKSKGLQFRYVLIPFCSWSFDHDTWRAPNLWVKSDVPLFKDAGYVPVRYGQVLDKTHFSDAYREEFVRTYLDNLNLLYVALTRAEKGLVIFAPDPDNPHQKRNVGNLLYESIRQSEKFNGSFDTAAMRLVVGSVVPEDASTATTDESLSVTLENYSVSPWRQKLIIRKSAGDFFKGDDSRRKKINYGIHIHAVLSRITTAADIPMVLKDLEMEGMITTGENGSLAAQLDVLMRDARIASWFNGEWTVKTEVPILLPDGSENRIDRLMICERRAVVVDFKTGEPVKADQKQVQEYINILRRMNFPEVEGYLLYIRTGELISITPVKARAVRRKDETQLDLGLGS
jgi:ATP-dependent helicase/nuclease subunit A